MAFRFGETLGNLNDITPHDIVDFLRKLRGGTAPRDKTPPSHLRNLFRFLFWSGKTKRDLAASIPRVAQPAKSTLPRYLKPEEVEKLLDAVWAADPVGRRNYAMLWCSHASASGRPRLLRSSSTTSTGAPARS